MEVEARSSRNHINMHQPCRTHMQPGGEEMWEYFPCPFCYIEVEVPFLCNHLQEEHCFDFKNAVCPLCADNMGKDMISHFRIHHSQSLKKRKSHKTSSWNDNSYQNETESYEEENSFNEIGPNQLDSAPDPLLSQFFWNSTSVDSDSVKVNHASGVTSPAVSSHKTRSVSHALQNLDKQDLEERIQRVKFVREMIISTIF
ncbi:hypothetical protein LUZ60_013536 [Juncus effusus]|nr:hypothetical protein LUZ60_013536 [Juncus effusus]